ncbi:CDP-diacylglycerol-glycerol-3-phosphate mitochondrial-like protein [Blastocystis sp. subtype 4]|uniref:CDP-diacylglycerol-glycerol-3-phosphate mitochondrial-like protein n=1 Tax=Blastocystis sp. subtype 4 TaxID=944170 RepID=UPI0007121BFB|nr:CDP-diacylglycerol-glycerol-3-phosphate mitochondrial-like protein [Blastocystis sp. subtype 4]KNB42607.1 CDP-diacylglycerol-glycerol-3-phosphate mitochondrial-like protein [Blastocystis sp. subtype 4]|eukprot:XP_014526050.1 CDP-diacylglycerol-glycerol-3-phosphate mitochondrial-like protein [Blastocystis sp. subtype 4]
MLSPLCVEHGERHQVYLYTPVLSENLITQFLPPRWNEILSVYHIKSYIFDNNMIISGANLSHDYFTNRIDRYVLFENCADLIGLYEKFFSILASYCSYITSTGAIHVSSKKTHQQFCSEVKSLLHTKENFSIPTKDSDVMVYPTFQQEALNLTCDYDAFKRVLELANRFTDIDLFLTSGYVNFPPEVVELLTSFKGEMKFLFAAPQANSFFHDPGFASVIPALYNILQCNFFHRCKEKSANTCFLEYLNKNWTYHSKGLWLFRKNSPESLVTIGSPNFGMRSYFRDMESQLYMISESPNYILSDSLL